jgi:hypothetical protein
MGCCAYGVYSIVIMNYLYIFLFLSDPSEHAKRQVSELDKTAKRSMAKRKAVTENIASNTKQLAQLDHQIASLRIRCVCCARVYFNTILIRNVK